MGVLKVDDLWPDKVHLVVDWDTMRVGDSVFIPCINVAKAVAQVTKVFKRRGWTPRIHVSVERNILGVRIWRIT